MLAATNAASSLVMDYGKNFIIILEDFFPSKNEQLISLYTFVTHNHQKFHINMEVPLIYGK